LRTAARNRLAPQDEVSLRSAELPPGAGRQRAQGESADADADQAERGMAEGGGEAADLAVLAFHQFEAQPAGGHGLAQADRRGAGRDFRLRLEHPRAAGQGFSTLNDDSLSEEAEGVGGRDALDLGPILALVGVARMEQALVQSALIAEQEQALGVGVEPPDGIDPFRETEFRQRAAVRTIGSEPGEDAVWFVEGN